MPSPVRPANKRFAVRWLDRAFLATCAIGIAYLFAQILLYAYGRDQGIYAVVADTVLRGGMPYRDAWDFKPPGIYLVFAAVRAIFGPAQIAIRVVEVLGLASMVWAFTIFSQRFFRSWRVGLVGGALAVLVHAQLEFWHTAQPESFGGMAIAWALVLATFEPNAQEPNGRRKQIAAWAGAGLLYGFAGLLKPPLGGGALISAVFAATRIRKNGGRWGATALPILVMGATSTGLVGACALWFVARGAWKDLYETLFVFTPHYTSLGWEGGATIPGMIYLATEEWLVHFSSANAAGMLAAVALAPLAGREREGVVHVVAVVFVQLVGVAMQGKFFPYHYGSTLLLGGLLAGLGAYKVWRRAVRGGAWGIVSYAVLTVLVLKGRTATRDTDTDFIYRCIDRVQYIFSRHSQQSRDELDKNLYSVADVSFGADRRVADLLRTRLAPADSVFIWGFEPMIYDMAERRPASRYIYNVPQRVEWYRDRARPDLMRELEARPPRAVVIERRDVFPGVTGDAIDSADTLRTFPELQHWIWQKYDLGATIEDFEIYFAKGG
jgi:hypothetical protein